MYYCNIHINVGDKGCILVNQRIVDQIHVGSDVVYLKCILLRECSYNFIFFFLYDIA